MISKKGVQDLQFSYHFALFLKERVFWTSLLLSWCFQRGVGKERKPEASEMRKVKISVITAFEMN